MTAPFLLTGLTSTSAPNIALPSFEASSLSYDPFGGQESEGVVIVSGGSWIVTVTGTGQREAEHRLIVAGYEKLAKQSQREKSYEAARRARRDRNRALRSV